MKTKLFFIIFLGILSLGHAQFQVGQDIEGNALGQNLGRSIAINQAGNRIVVGSAPSTIDIDPKLQVFDLINDTWTQVGQDITDDTGTINVGRYASINNFGDIIAVSDPSSGTSQGIVRIFQLFGNTWTQLGTDIIGTSGENIGAAINLNGAGNLIIVGTLDDTARVYEYNPTTDDWETYGQTLTSNSTSQFNNFQFGRTVDINDNGTKIVVGARFDETIGFRSGQVTVYEYIFGTWTPVGPPINGNAGDALGNAVSMDSSGNIVAVGTSSFSTTLNNVGKTEIFEFNGTDWIQVGNDIIGDDENGNSGSIVSLSDDGTRVAIGEPFRDGGGRTIVYNLDSNSWNPYYDVTLDIFTTGRTGEVVALSGNGQYLLESNPGNSDNFIANGQARVFFLGCDTETTPPNVMTQDITVDLDENGQATITPEQINNGSTDNCEIVSYSLSQDQFTCNDAFANNNKGISFNGVDQHIEIADDTSNDISGSYTMSCWVKYDATGPALQRPISKPSASDGTGTCIAMSNTGAVGLTFIDGSSGAPNGLGSAPNTILPDTWTHVAITYDETTNIATVYANGTSVASGTVNPIFPNSSQPLFIGTEGIGSNFLTFRRFKGEIDEVRIWNIARTQSEIMADMNQRIEPQPGLVGLYRFNEGTGTVVNDASGFAPNGNFVNLDETTDWVDGAPSLDSIGENQVMLTATDGNNNSASASATVTVRDNLPPNVVTQNIVVALSCDNINDVTIDASQIDNGSTDNCSIADMSLDLNYFDITNIGDNTVTLTVTDTSGNSNSETAVVTVVDYRGNNVLYVNQNANGNDTGANWTNAFTDLQNAINVASTCTNITEIWVASGIYKPSVLPRGSAPVIPNNFFDSRNFSFHLVDNVAMYGGFSGYENNVSERELSQNPTILSGDLGVINDSSDNAVNIIISINDSSNTKLDGFIIENGNADRLFPVISGDPCEYDPCDEPDPAPDGGAAIEGQTINFSDGGAINAFGSSLSIQNCVFRTNSALITAPVFFNGGGSPNISNSLFYNNTGNLFILTVNQAGSGQAKLNNLTFINNTLNLPIGSNAIVSISGDSTINNSVLYNNVTGIDISSTNPNSTNNFVSNNGGNGTLLGSDPFTNSLDIDGGDNLLGTDDDGLLPASGGVLENSGSVTAETADIDIFGNPRIAGSAVDVGAYERQLEASDFMDNHIYVNLNATGNNTGESWANAFTSLNEALETAENFSGITEIWVASGTYKPSKVPSNADFTAQANYMVSPRDYTFKMVNGVAMIGGFNGTETTRNSRSSNTNPTILSGDINNTPSDTSDDIFHVIISVDDVSNQTKLENFEIVLGNANSNTLYQINGTNIGHTTGGGIFTHNSSLVVEDSKISDCRASSAGGGVYSFLSNSLYRNVRFINNIAGRQGGGMQSTDNTNVVVNCLFSGNTAGIAGTPFIGGGGAIFNVGNSSNTNRFSSFINTVIDDNFSLTNASGLRQGSGNFKMQNCTITNNSQSDVNGGVVVSSATIGNMTDNVIYNPGYLDMRVADGDTFMGTSNLLGTPASFYTPPTLIGFSTLLQDPFVAITDPDGLDDIFGTDDDGLIPTENGGLVKLNLRTVDANTEPLDFAGQPRLSGSAIDVGAYEFQNVLGITDFDVNTIGIYPNPAKNTIIVNGLKSEYSVEIYSISGQKVLETNLSISNNTLDVSKFTTGVYFLKIDSQTIKFIKQ